MSASPLMRWASGTFPGQLVSSKNRRRIVGFKTGRPRLIKSKPALDYEKAAAKEVWRGAKGIEGPVSLTAHVFYSTRRPDLDVQLLMDVLQKARVILDDRQIHQIIATKYVDKVNPRVEWQIRSIPEPRHA